MRRKALVLPIFLVLLLAVAGCGSDSDETAQAGEQTLTKKQFVNLTEKFCEKEYKAEEVDMERYAKKHDLELGQGNPVDEEKIYKAVLFDYVRDKIAYFKSLPAPEGDEKEVRAMIVAFEDGLRNSEEVPAAIVAPRPGAKPLPDFWTKSYHTTSKYGPWLCGQP